MRTAALFVVLVTAAHAAPKLRPRPPAVAVGAEFAVPWPPVHIAPPAYHCRVERVAPEGVSVRVLNHVAVGEWRLHVEPDGRAWSVPWADDLPLPTAAMVRRLIDAGRE
jgi:hypothetical protein